jgi:GNAT superfamily N-acetyltransferase
MALRRELAHGARKDGRLRSCEGGAFHSILAIRSTGSVRSSENISIRRVGFRSGTDAELTALHDVETPVAAELRSNRMPQPIDSYIAFARNLPSQFNHHAWLAEQADGTPVACGFCWSNSAGDQRVMECDISVRPDKRPEGIGSQLFAQIYATTVAEGRSLLTWVTFDGVPAGEEFSRGLGAQPARANRMSEFRLADVDWAMIDEWAKAHLARERGYRLEMIDGVFPEHLRADAGRSITSCRQRHVRISGSVTS